MNRIDRLSGILLMLQNQRLITAEQIAAHFEISVRTVYRDLAALGEAGVPLLAEPGVGYSLMRGYHVPPIQLTAHEAMALFLAAEVAEQIVPDGTREALRAALLKVRSVLPQENKDRLQRLRGTIGVRFQPPAAATAAEAATLQPPAQPQPLLPLQDAIAQRHCLALHYRTASRGELTQRVVEPLGVCFYAGHWHLIAWCRLRADMRDFRLDRFERWLVLPETFRPHEGFSLQDFLDEPIHRGDLIPVTLALALADRPRLRHFAPVVEHSCQVFAESGRCQLELLTWSLEWLCHALMSFGPSVEVFEPESLRQDLQDLAQLSAAHHADFSKEDRDDAAAIKFAHGETLLT